MSHVATPSILYVDLTRGRCRRLPLAEAARDRDLGGRGLAAAVREVAPAASFDDPEAVVALCPGRLTGLDLPGGGRLAAAWLSPLTGGVADAGFGGRLGPAIARAGLAGVVLTGLAPRPCGLRIRDDEARLVPAAPLVGEPTGAVFDALGALDGALVTGPAAWGGASPLAGAVADRWHGPCRGGLGLAMAAKNCLYVAATGHGALPVADPAGLGRARAAIRRLIDASPALGPGGVGRFGGAALFDLTHGRRMMPTRNFRETYFPPALAGNAPRLDAACGSLAVPCPGCPVGCRRILPGGRLFPDADALAHFTALLGLADPALAVAATTACLERGLDPVSTAATLACRAEIEDRIPTAETVLGAIEAMALGRGVGAALGRGARAYGAGCGRPGTAMTVKGLELPAFDPRGAYGLALGLAVSAGGPDPWRAGCLAHEILRKPVATDRFSFEGKARAVFLGENAVAALESLGVCPWLGLATGLEEWSQALGAVTGREVSAGDLARLGERVVLGERAFNWRHGLGAAEDDLPARFFTEPGSGGDGIAVPPLSRPDFLAARETYYRLRGLAPDGRPEASRLAASGLAWTR